MHGGGRAKIPTAIPLLGRERGAKLLLRSLARLQHLSRATSGSRAPHGVSCDTRFHELPFFFGRAFYGGSPACVRVKVAQARVFAVAGKHPQAARVLRAGWERFGMPLSMGPRMHS